MFGNSDWLDGQMSLVDYGDRGVPNVFLAAPLTSNGTWNAAHFKNPQYDSLVKQYVAALDLQTQKQIAGKIQRLLLEETPIVIPYWIDGLTASTPGVERPEPDLDRAALPQHRVEWAEGTRGQMTAFILKRLGLALITLWILSLIVFFAGQILPGDPGRAILGPLAAQSAVKALDHQLGVDKPLLDPVLELDHPLPREPRTQYQAPIGPILTSALGTR